MTVSVSQLKLIMPKAPLPWLEAFQAESYKWGVDTANEMASFIAQVAHESKEFTVLEENLMYRTAERIAAVWPRRFKTVQEAEPYRSNPAALANFVYANRLGNGKPLTGDGYRFRGRGPIQLTGRDNYTKAGRALKVDLLAYPEMLLVPVTGIRSAFWFWTTNGLDSVDDDEDIRAETKAVNGAELGLPEREHYFQLALKVLK